MTSREVRIGNFVFLGGKETVVEDMDDEGINSFYPGHEDDGDTWSGWFDNPYIPEKAIFGIKLTERILEKCRFVKEPDTYGNAWYVRDGIFVMFKNGDIKCNHFGIPIPVKYLHQLQNIYFDLTGNELEYW